jgi:predicted acyl esterase
MVRPPVDVYSPAPGSVIVHRDVPVTTRDGTVLRVNVYLPPGDDTYPVVLCAHPYGKDNHPKKRKRLPGHSIPFQYRALRQPAAVRFSALTGWEAPDPAWWTAHGFAVVNCDLRGAGHSDGVGSVLSDQEGEDVYDLIEWAGEQSWSTGAVGMLGVSYLAISQWKAASMRPPHLRAIVPWEGFTDAYRDLMRPGGIQEVGFVKLWSRELRNIRLTYQVGEENTKHPLRDDFWRSLVPNLGLIEVPALICGSFSDNNLHTRGSIRAFENISSPARHLFTHREGKWANFYSEQSLRAQLNFLDRHLRDGEGAPPPRVRLEIRESLDQVVEVRDESSWPLERTKWTPLYLTNDGLRSEKATVDGSMSFDVRSHGIKFGWTVPHDVELTGPMALRLFVTADGADDVDLFVGVEKWRGGAYVPFEGSYGFGRDRVTTGWLRASMRALDRQQSRPFAPVHMCTERQPMRAGDIVDVDIALGPSATVFRRGEQLRLVIAGRWLWPRNPLTGQFPGAYERRSRGTATVHWGPQRQAHLLIPVVD